MRFKTMLFLFVLFSFSSCSQNPYDTSTPEKFVISLGLIGQQPEDHNPLPYFYEKEMADAIFSFDQAAEEGLTSFNTFRNLLTSNFPKFIQTNQEGMIKIAVDGLGGFNTRNFTYSASRIAPQMRERNPSDYEFVSASEPDQEGISELNVKISGNVATIRIKKTEQGFVMFSTEEQIKNIHASVAKIKQMNEVFTTGTNLIHSGELTEENFKEKIENLANQYFEVVR